MMVGNLQIEKRVWGRRDMEIIQLLKESFNVIKAFITAHPDATMWGMYIYSCFWAVSMYNDREK